MNGQRAKSAPADVDGHTMDAHKHIRRILHLSATNFYGGPERQIVGHALAVDQQLYRIIVAAFTEDGAETELVRRAQQEGVTAETIPVANAYDPRAIGRIGRLIDKHEIEIVVSHNYRSHLLGRRAARIKNIRHIAVSRGWTAENLKVRFFHWLDKITLHKSDVVICVSESKKTELQGAGVPEQRLIVIPNAVTVPEKVLQPTVDWRARFGWDLSAALVVSAGRLSREKGPDIFVAAIPEILRRCPTGRFILFGDGPLKDDLAAQINELGLAETVRLAGHIPDLPRELPSLNILVNPSRSEGMPNIILEAMAAQLPVVGTAVGGVVDLIADGKTGRLVPSANPAALAAAVVELLDKREQAARFADAAWRMIQTEYTFTAQARRYEQIYNRVAPNRDA